jgi:hypothetical protein
MNYLQAVAQNVLDLLALTGILFTIFAPLLIGAVVTEVTDSNAQGFKVAGYLTIVQVVLFLLLSPFFE